MIKKTSEIAFIIILLFFTYLKSNAVEIVNYNVPISVFNTAKSYINVVEIGNNTGAEVEMFLRSVGLPKGNPYCMAFVYYCFKENGITQFKTGLANGYYSNMKKKYGCKDTLISNRVGIICWKYSNSNSGHIGFVSKLISRNYIQTIEGNTSFDDSSPDGRIYKGKQGVFVKTRRVGNLGNMKLRGIIQ